MLEEIILSILYSYYIDWRHVLNFKLKKIKENQVKQFNFKLLHNVLPFKDNLFKWKIAPDIVCKYCNKPESSLHILLKCRQVIDFWKRIHSLLLNLFKHDISIDEQLIVIGINTDDSKFMLINVLCTICNIYKIYILNIHLSHRHHQGSITYQMLMLQRSQESICFGVV